MYSCTHLQIGRNPWLGGYRPPIPVLSALCPQLNLLNPTRKKFLGMPLAIEMCYTGYIDMAINTCYTDY
jgi:hypothetical protein